MYKILMVCHGNICRSPMAEFILRDMLKKRGTTNVEVASAATSTEEIGNGVHRGTRAVLHSLGIDCSFKRARQMKRSDYTEYDLLLGADSRNIINMKLIAGGDDESKIMRLLDLTDRPRDIADPWYTGNFDETYNDLDVGLDQLINNLKKK